MNNNQKQLLVDRMNRLDEESMNDHAEWATIQFGMDVSVKECSDLFIDYAFRDKSNALRFLH